MIKSLKKIALSLGLFSALLMPVALPSITFAASDIQNNLCSGVNLDATGASTSCAGTADEGTSRLQSIIQNVVNLFSLIVGVVAVVMIIVGGLKYITSGGESGNVTGAKNTILYAIIGLIIVALAQIIVHFVLGKVTTTA